MEYAPVQNERLIEQCPDSPSKPGSLTVSGVEWYEKMGKDMDKEAYVDEQLADLENWAVIQE